MRWEQEAYGFLPQCNAAIPPLRLRYPTSRNPAFFINSINGS